MPRWLSLVFEKLIQLLSKESSVIGSKISNPSSPDVAKWRGLPVRGVAFVGRTMGSIRGEDGARWPNRCQKRWVVIVVIEGQSIPSWDRFLLLQEVKDALKCPALTFQWNK